MSDDPYKAPIIASVDSTEENSVLGTLMAMCGLVVLGLGATILVLIAGVLSSPMMNDAPTWPVEVKLLPAAIGLSLSGCCLLRLHFRGASIAG